MQKEIIYKKNYISSNLVEEIKDFIKNKNDSLDLAQGPYDWPKHELGWQGVWNRYLHLEIQGNPIQKVVSLLRNDFGDFEIYRSSVRYLSSPFLPHTDLKNVNFLKEFRNSGKKEGWIFLIPLWWEKGYQPGTAFLNSPPKFNEPMYHEMLDILPSFSTKWKDESINYSVKEIIMWENPGDLVAFEQFQFHASCGLGNVEYSRSKWVKEFIAIETNF